MAGAFDFKKAYKDLYAPKSKPSVIDVPEILFIHVHGEGNPNTSQEYKNAIEILYGLSYAIKMSKMNGTQPQGYYNYVVPPLEGLWWLGLGDDQYFDGKTVIDKDKLRWNSMIRQPEFVTQEVFEDAKLILSKKKPMLDLSLANLATWNEGLCAQIMHIGSYDDEPATIEILENFIIESGYKNDISQARKHHEIYLSDPRKTAPEKLKTIIRHPIFKS
ncbi:MAG: GyrI-like domain-containing protein [Prevotellaceae bacterium]|jgi:hypothetical protein|nr:GyrI-like domain-containing protein [Prevotellaceae bacterium]